MGEIIKRVPKRQLINYTEIQPLFGESTLLCVDLGVLAIIRAMLRERGLWQSTYYQQLLPENMYEQVEDLQFDDIDARVSAFLGEAEMTTCDELTQLLQSFQGGTGQGVCGCGSGGVGQSDEGPSPEDTGVPGFHIGDPPEGFADWNEYDDYKCRVAGHILDLWIDDIGFYKSVNIVGLAASGVAVALLLPGPLDDIVAILGLLAALSLQGLATAAMADMELAVTNNRDDLECAIYSANTATKAATDIGAAIDTAVDATTAAVYAPIIKEILKYQINNYTLNRLFEKFDPWDDAAPNNDCSACVPSGGLGDFTLLRGTLVAGSLLDGTTGFTIQSEFMSTEGCDRHQVQFLTPTGGCVEIAHSVDGGYISKLCSNDGFRWNGKDCATGNDLGTGVYAPATDCLLQGSSFFVRSQPTAQFNFTAVVNGACS